MRGSATTASPAPSPAKTSAARPAAESSASGSSWTAGASLSRYACGISKRTLSVWATRSASAGLSEPSGRSIRLPHGNGSDHLNRIRGGGLPQLSAASFGWNRLVCFSCCVVGVILVLGVQAELLKPSPPATLSGAAGPATLASRAASSRSAGRSI